MVAMAQGDDEEETVTSQGSKGMVKLNSRISLTEIL
jgi:hypothetical protein